MIHIIKLKTIVVFFFNFALNYCGFSYL